jgi:hypothetical protein
MCDFYKWTIEKYFNKKTPNGDFAYDLWRDTKTIAFDNNEQLFKYLNSRIWNDEVKEIYIKLRKKFLKKYYIRDKYTNSIYEKEDKEFFEGE